MKCFDFSLLKIFVKIDTFLQNIWTLTNRILFTEELFCWALIKTGWLTDLKNRCQGWIITGSQAHEEREQFIDQCHCIFWAGILKSIQKPFESPWVLSSAAEGAGPPQGAGWLWEPWHSMSAAPRQELQSCPTALAGQDWGSGMDTWAERESWRDLSISGYWESRAGGGNCSDTSSSSWGKDKSEPSVILPVKDWKVMRENEDKRLLGAL